MSDAFGLPLGGQSIVVADRESAISGREIVIPGLRYHPDRLPASPTPWDIEFSEPLRRGYTIVNSASLSTTTVPGCLSVTNTTTNDGVFWPAPPMPFTIVAKMEGWTGAMGNTSSGSQQTGLTLSAATPGMGASGFLMCGLWTTGSGDGNSGFYAYNGTSVLLNNFGTAAAFGNHPPVYLQLIVTSSTNIAFGLSFGGIQYQSLITGMNPGFTVGSMGFSGRNTATTVHWAYLRRTA